MRTQRHHIFIIFSLVSAALWLFVVFPLVLGISRFSWCFLFAIFLRLTIIFQWVFVSCIWFLWLLSWLWVYVLFSLRFCSYCLYMSSLYWDCLLPFAVWSPINCSPDISVCFLSITVLLSCMPIFVMCIL